MSGIFGRKRYILFFGLTIGLIFLCVQIFLFSHRTLPMSHIEDKGDDETPLEKTVMEVDLVKKEERPTTIIETKETTVLEKTDPMKTGQDLKKKKPAPPEFDDSTHIFFYAWYGNPTTDKSYSHWNHKVLPHWTPSVNSRHPSIGTIHSPPKGNIGADFYPTRGTYSSRDPITIKSQLLSLQSIGVHVIVLSYWGLGTSDANGKHYHDLLDIYYSICSSLGLKIAIHLEPYTGRSPQSIRKDVRTLIDRYGKHKAFYRVPGTLLTHSRVRDKPVPLLYIYDSYHIKESQWRTILDPKGSSTVRNGPLDAVFVSLYLSSGQSSSFVLQSKFDGIYSYFASDGFTEGSSVRSWPRISQWAKQHRLVWIPSVGPGYSDLRIRPWNGANRKERGDGKYYKRMWNAALEGEGPPQFVSITSYNEWHEGTQIEEAETNKVDGNGKKYLDYAPRKDDYYMKLTGEYVTKFTEMKRKRKKVQKSKK